MIYEEIKIIIHDILCQTREMLKFLKNIKIGKYNAYLDDLINYALCTEEDIKNIEHYIFELEIKLYNTLDRGENVESLNTYTMLVKLNKNMNLLLSKVAVE